jgi:hypothetical protein
MVSRPRDEKAYPDDHKCRRKADLTKKNKTWEGDAYLSCIGPTVTMISERGKESGLELAIAFADHLTDWALATGRNHCTPVRSCKLVAKKYD